MLAKRTIKASRITHRGEPRIKLEFIYDKELIKKVKQLDGCRWSQTKRCWHIPYREDYENFLSGYFHLPADEEKEDNVEPKACLLPQHDPWQKTENAPTVLFPIAEKNPEDKKPARAMDNLDEKGKTFFRDYTQVMELKRLSPRTREIYSDFFIQFLVGHNGKDICQLSYKNLYDYILEKAANLNYTRKKQCISAIKFYYEKALGRQKMYFNLGKKKQVDISVVSIPFYQFRKNCEGIKSATDKLLLFIVFVLNYQDKDICSLKAGFTEKLFESGAIRNSEKAADYLAKLLEAHIEKTGNREYIFENNKKPVTIDMVNRKIQGILSRYRLHGIYFLQFGHYLDSTDYSGQTKSTYRGMFMKLLIYL